MVLHLPLQRFQFTTRYFADHFVVQYGPHKVAKTCLWIMLAGVILVAVAPAWPLALVGIACLGAGSSVIFPLAMPAAAQLKDRPAAVNVTALTHISLLFSFLPHLCLALWLNILASAMLLQFVCPWRFSACSACAAFRLRPLRQIRNSRDGS